MDDEGVSSEEEDIFAGVPAPASETESEYQNSEDEGDRIGRKAKSSNGANDREDDPEEDGSENEPLRAPETSPATQQLSQVHTSSKRKDSPVKLDNRQSKKSRATWTLHAKYRDLLNDDIADMAARKISTETKQLEDSQIGVVFWSSIEKDAFFNALSRLGQDNIQGISQHIATKSEPEVSNYLSLLRSSFISKRTRGLTYDLPDLPAAAEISEECCDELENTADAFAALQDEHEMKAEKEKWGESWLLTPETSYWLNKKRVKRGGEKAINVVLPAVNLFDLDTWLELPSRLFMNAGPKENEDNWHNIVQDEHDVPTIRATAFEDFHSLAVWMTRKLVSTTLFCAMSRLRAQKSTKIKAAEVNEHDVRGAIDVLKMEHDAQEFWLKSARRCRLQIVDDEQLNESSSEQDFDNLRSMSYNEVEAALSMTQRRGRSRSRSLSHMQPLLSSNTSANEDSIFSLEEATSYTPRSPSPTSSIDTMHPRAREKRALALTQHNTLLESYTVSLDHQASLAEELRLWSILKKDPPSSILQQIAEIHGQEAVKRPSKKEEERDERYEWREWMSYRSEWEDQGMGPREEEFEENRALRGDGSRDEEKRRGIGQNGLSSEFVDDEDEDEEDGE